MSEMNDGSRTLRRSGVAQGVAAAVLVSCSVPSSAPPDSLRDAGNVPAKTTRTEALQEVVDWLRAHGAPLTTTEPGHGFDDLEPIGAMIGDARVVALGEATHGTREFARLKHRVLEYLVSEQGFSVFAIEANQPECRAINDYVVYGRGTARAALEGIYFWSLNTEEMLALIEWMRAWNVDPNHQSKIQFVGVDMQKTPVARDNVIRFVKRVEPRRADRILRALIAGPPTDMSPVVLAELARRFDASRRRWTAATDAATYANARHDVTILQQAVARAAMATEPERFEARDRDMADNLAWILEQQPDGARAILWAHNAHVARELGIRRNLGHFLHERLGRDYVVFGFLFGSGTFRALDGRDIERGPLELPVQAPDDTDVAAPFASTGEPVLVADLRTLPRSGPVRDWFHAPHLGREAGASFSGAWTPRMMVLPSLYDAVIYVDQMTSTRLLSRTGGR